MVTFPLFQRLAQPIRSGRKIPDIEIHHGRMIRLIEVLPHGGTPFGG
jgi:hypothetical protein